jgi:hypothetical protein
MGFLKGIAMNPRVEGGFVLPTGDHHDLVCFLRSQNFHRDEARKILHESSAIRESLYYVVGHPLFHR